MQLGIFAAIPLVADRQKLILKRLQATPLRRWQLVGSNVLMRLLIAVVQTIIIVGVGATLLRRRDRRLVARDLGVDHPRVRDVHRPRLRDRLVRRDRGRRQRDDERGPVPADVPVGDVLPDRGDAGRAEGRRPAAAADLPQRRAPPGDGRRHAVRAALVLRRVPRRSGWSAASSSPAAGSSGSEPPRAQRGQRAYQRSSWRRSERADRPPARFGRSRSAGSAG